MISKNHLWGLKQDFHWFQYLSNSIEGYMYRCGQTEKKPLYWKHDEIYSRRRQKKLKKNFNPILNSLNKIRLKNNLSFHNSKFTKFAVIDHLLSLDLCSRWIKIVDAHILQMNKLYLIRSFSNNFKPENWQAKLKKPQYGNMKKKQYKNNQRLYRLVQFLNNNSIQWHNYRYKRQFYGENFWTAQCGRTPIQNFTILERAIEKCAPHGPVRFSLQDFLNPNRNELVRKQTFSSSKSGDSASCRPLAGSSPILHFSYWLLKPLSTVTNVPRLWLEPPYSFLGRIKFESEKLLTGIVPLVTVTGRVNWRLAGRPIGAGGIPAFADDIIPWDHSDAPRTRPEGVC